MKVTEPASHRGGGIDLEEEVWDVNGTGEWEDWGGTQV